MLLENPVIWYFILFHVAIGLLSRKIASAVWYRKEDERMREVVGRYMPSLVHATLSTFWDFVPGIFGGADPLCNLFGNSGAYFIADMIVDRDPDYFFHHLAPLLWGEALLRTGANYHHSVRCIRIIEAGNVIAHTAAIITGRSGEYFHAVNTFSFWVSRPLSMPDGFLAWYADILPEKQYSLFGLIVLGSFFATFYINGKWMIKMCMPREKAKKEGKETNGKTNGKTNETSTNGTTNGKTNGNVGKAETKRVTKGKKLKSTK